MFNEENLLTQRGLMQSRVPLYNCVSLSPTFSVCGQQRNEHGSDVARMVSLLYAADDDVQR